MRLPVLFFTLGLCTPALADYPQAVSQVLSPGYAAFETATADLAAKAAASCETEAISPAFHVAFDAWLAVAPLKLGPAEEDGKSLAIAYWPDPKALGAKAQRGLLAGPAEDLAPARFAEQSVAARGFSGLERLLWPTAPLPADPCPLIRATTDDLARMAREIRADWDNRYAAVILTAGEPGNTTFLTRPEVRQALFTQIDAALEHLIETRLGRPLGSFERPRPELAESRASGRSLRNVSLTLLALRNLCESLTPDIPKTLTAFDHAIALADGLNDPVFAGVASPEGRLRVEILQQSIRAIQDNTRTELARDLDVDLGFNAADGD